MQGLDREKLILKYVVDIHIRTGEPVGSRQVAKRLPFELSPATIRNVMADLEEKNLLMQPHHSAGRIPTDKGYRAYIDEMLQPETLTPEEQQAIRSAFYSLVSRMGHLAEGSNDILLSSARVLADISNELGVILAPRFNQSVFERLQFYKLESDRLLVELNLKNGFVKTVIWDLRSDLTMDDLRRIASALNEQLSGLTVEEIRKTIPQRTEHLRYRFAEPPSGLIRLIVEAADELFNFDPFRIVNYSGADHVIGKPELTDRQELKALMELLEDTERLTRLINARGGEEPLSVMIGQEHSMAELSGFSLIAADFNVGEATGRIGLIGPKRMPYARMIPLVRFSAQTLENIIHQRYPEVHEVHHV